MKKTLCYLVILFTPMVCFADGHLTEDQKRKQLDVQEFTIQIV